LNKERADGGRENDSGIIIHAPAMDGTRIPMFSPGSSWADFAE